MGISRHVYWSSPVYRKISNRLQEKYRIDLSSHIDSMLHVARRDQEGITFVPRRDQMLISALEATKNFHHDNRAHVPLAVAALATKGQGYRELGMPSLHCQIGRGECNIHVDYVGFAARGPDGQTYLGPDAIQHIADELGWAWLADKFSGGNPFIRELLGRLHPRLPNSVDKFRPTFGVQFDLLRGQSRKLDRRWAVTVDITGTCRDSTCRDWEKFKGLTLTIRE